MSTEGQRRSSAPASGSSARAQQLRGRERADRRWLSYLVRRAEEQREAVFADLSGRCRRARRRVGRRVGRVRVSKAVHAHAPAIALQVAETHVHKAAAQLPSHRTSYEFQPGETRARGDFRSDPRAAPSSTRVHVAPPTLMPLSYLLKPLMTAQEQRGLEPLPHVQQSDGTVC